MSVIRCATVSLSLVWVFLTSTGAQAWDYFGHHVVGVVAWDQMDGATRRAVVDLLLEAPPDADLASLLPPGPRSMEVRRRELFLKVNAWADLIRDELFPDRKERYDHPAWHYVNRFWKSTAEGPVALEERGTMGDLVVTLERLRGSLVARSMPAAERAIDLAWVLHLVGDVHQPLHSSGRVTELEPKGDRGGNDFLLDDLKAPNVHAYWDVILRRASRQHHSEGSFAWASRVAREIQQLHPPDALRDAISIDDVDSWSKEGVEVAMRAAYPDYLNRNAAPPRRYQDEVFEQAARQAALAGYRLERLLDQSFSGMLHLPALPGAPGAEPEMGASRSRFSRRPDS